MTGIDPQPPEKLTFSQALIWRIIDAIIKNAPRFTNWAGVAFLLWLLVPVLQSWAGKETVVSLLVSVGASLSIGKWASYLFAVACLGWGYNERKLRRKAIQRLAVRIKELEGAIDPNRTSSNLAADGTTHPDDL